MDSLIKNLAFIHSITAGAFWIQSGFMQVSSNLYDVEVPGRFRYYLCKGNVKVDWTGKVRSLNDDQVGYIMSKFTKISNKDAISKVPDMYTITLGFQSLMPNNFNTQLNYLIGNNKVSVGQFKEEKTAEIAIAVKNKISEINNKNKDAAENNHKNGNSG